LLVTRKSQRLRDPVHDLIEFDDSEFEQKVWRLLESAPFQRLRRIKQLGFSDFVFPGATHSRFAHSVGVFHTARMLAKAIHMKNGGVFDEVEAQVAMAAALIHDVGHGPFSHAFEKALGLDGKHEEWTRSIVLDTEVGEILDSGSTPLKDRVASIFEGESDTPTTIYSSMVSSQFDADRLDYMQRDRMMSGAKSSAIDLTWLLANLEIHKVSVGSDETSYADVDTFVLGEKAVLSGEAYVLALFHLYPSVYLHKTTRGIEKLFGLFLELCSERVIANDYTATGMTKRHRVIHYLKNQDDLDAYLSLNDSVMWGALQEANDNGSGELQQVASRLLHRKLFKAIDVQVALDVAGRDGKLSKFKRILKERFDADPNLKRRILIDQYERNPYKRRGYDSPKALEKIHVRRGGSNVDLSDCSQVVKALEPFNVYRAYVADDDSEARELVCSLLAEAKK
jgi:uncharacterized protein